MNLKKCLFLFSLKKKTALSEMKMLGKYFLFNKKTSVETVSQISHFKISLCRKTVSLLPTGRDRHPPTNKRLSPRQRIEGILTSAGLSSSTGGRCHWLPPSPGGSQPQRGCGSHGNPWVCVHMSDWSLQLLEHSDCKKQVEEKQIKICYSMYSRSVVLSRSSLRTDFFFPYHEVTTQIY